MIENPKYYSNGKLLITGEYLILKGALALAMPVKYGQSLKLINNNSKGFVWEAQVLDKNWFHCKFDLSNWTILESNNEEKAIYLQNILKIAGKLNPSFKNKLSAKKAISKINFDINWGLGSSSSLISNISYLSETNPFHLHFVLSNGSGYDIACARTQSPILYKIDQQKPIIKEVVFDPEYQSQLNFLYLGKKQDTTKSVNKFLQKGKDYIAESRSISEISKEVLSAKKIEDFNYLVCEHNLLLSSVLKTKNLKDEYFSSFEGEVKPLGAWGGDFALIASSWDRQHIKKYFQQKGFSTLIPFDEMKLIEK
ncbi:MAG: GYDIA family GHMP kinase [Bacteroidota bacterium]|nr:GYDIA family GHMP kinase [Bacteroidota bacterium]